MKSPINHHFSSQTTIKKTNIFVDDMLSYADLGPFSNRHGGFKAFFAGIFLSYGMTSASRFCSQFRSYGT